MLCDLLIAGASDPRSSLVEVGMGPVGLAVFPLVVQLAASDAVGSDRGIGVQIYNVNITLNVSPTLNIKLNTNLFFFNIK